MGRGSAEGYGFDIGYALRGQTSRSTDGQWDASFNALDLDRHFATKEEGQVEVVGRIIKEVKLILVGWRRYQDAA